MCVVVISLGPSPAILILSVVVVSLGPGPVIWIVGVVVISLGPSPVIWNVGVVVVSWVPALPYGLGVWWLSVWSQHCQMYCDCGGCQLGPIPAILILSVVVLSLGSSPAIWIVSVVII